MLLKGAVIQTPMKIYCLNSVYRGGGYEREVRNRGGTK